MDGNVDNVLFYFFWRRGITIFHTGIFDDVYHDCMGGLETDRKMDERILDDIWYGLYNWVRNMLCCVE